MLYYIIISLATVLGLIGLFVKDKTGEIQSQALAWLVLCSILWAYEIKTLIINHLCALHEAHIQELLSQ